MTSFRRLAAFALVAALVGTATPAAAQSDSQIEADFRVLINQARAEADLPALSTDPDLSAGAAAHSRVMAGEGRLHHSPAHAVDLSRWRSLGENVGVGPDVGVLDRAFLRSPAHRANVLGEWSHAGVGVAVADGLIWVTVVFAAARVPPAVTPAASGGLVDPGRGRWHLTLPSGAELVFYYGNPGDRPIAGDWDCDGVDTPGLYRRSDGYVYLRNSNTAGIADLRFYFGNPGDLPVAGDFDGDGCDTVSLYRPSERRVYVINRLGDSGRGLGAAEWSHPLVGPGDVPVAGDSDGDGIDTVTAQVAQAVAAGPEWVAVAGVFAPAP
jgi:hypothetical protein